MNLVEIRDKENDFSLVAKINFELASCLNVGDTFLPEETGFVFIVVDKFTHIQNYNIVPGDTSKFDKEYSLQLNIIEYMTFFEKIKKVLFNIKPYSYWDFKENNFEKLK